MNTQIQRKFYDRTRQLYEYDILDSGSSVIGLAQLRLKPSKSQEMPAGFESHIYYEIEPEFRMKGHATEALGLVLKEAGKLGLDSVILTVEPSNIASKKVIEHNNGKLLSKSKTTEDKVVLKYRIDIEH